MQHAAPRTRLTAGIALASAGAIAAAPIVAPPLPAPSVLQSRAVQLTAGWDDVWQTAEANATDIWNHFSADPFPALAQQLANQTGYLEGLFNGSLSFDEVAKDIEDNLSAVFGSPATDTTDALPGALFGPFLPDGGATSTLYQSLDDVVTAGGLIGSIITHNSLFGLLDSALPGIVTGIGLDESATPVVQSLLDFAASPLSGVVLGQLGTMLSPVLQFNDDISAISEALTGATPDWGAALQDLMSMPENITNAFLNGYGEVDLMPLLGDLGITLPHIAVLDLDTYITELSVNLGGLLSPAGSLFDGIGLGSTTDALGDPTLLFDLPGVAVGPIASLVEMGQAIAMALGWDGTGDMLATLF